jgi:hypothetical protein
MRFKPTLSTLWALLAIALPAAAAPTPSLDELWRVVQQQQSTIEQMNKKLDATLQQLAQAESKLAGAESKLASTETKLATTETKLADNEKKLEATADAVEAKVAGGEKSSSPSWADRTSLGGYGELHYNHLDNDGVAGGNQNRTDFHRFVIYMSHEFNSWLRFGSELEVEHAVASSEDPGEVEVEQAWVEMDLNDKHRLRTGLDLLPVGIINTTHEPNTFYGVERNAIESEIIPSTWWEGGAAASGEIRPGLSYDVVMHTGLIMPFTGNDAFRPRAGRTQIAEADDHDVAFTGRLRYTGIAGLELATSGQYQADYTGTGDAAEAAAYLIETHLDYRHASGFGLRALYARWELGADRNHGLDPGSVGADHLSGWYVEPAYRFALAGLLPAPGEIGVFSRYARWDQADGLGGRFRNYERVSLGLNYWPVPQVVFKIDGQFEDADGRVRREFDGFNLGFGYQF